MSTRRTKLVDCNPRWMTSTDDERQRYLRFECPEGHDNCEHIIPFTPALDGTDAGHKGGGAVWQRSGGDAFDTLTLSPSILRRPTIREDGTVFDACALHIFIRDGGIEFCGDSR